MRLSAYFSRADENYTSDGIKNLSVGNTEVVANIIHDLTGADLFKIIMQDQQSKISLQIQKSMI